MLFIKLRAPYGKGVSMKEKNTSKVLGFFDYVMYTAGLNLLFLLCSIPVFTMGASLTALYAGLRAMIKKEACFHAFFSTFRKSFARSTVLWVILLPLNVLLIVNLALNFYYLDQGSVVALILSALFVVIPLGITTMIFLFYSRFEGSLSQLLRYGCMLFFSHPLRALLIAGLTWAPFAVFFCFPSVFFMLGMVWLFFYFSVVATVAVWLMNRPFISFALNVLGMDVPGYKRDPAQPSE